jgi:glycosyltransferase involved in cell wall biosynthesis
MSDAVKITVIVCTYNRCRTLDKAIRSVVDQAISPSLGWEILIVDNNSSDETPQLVEELRQRYPVRIRYILEQQKGVSHARNAGIREARGEILAFIDDDETAHPDWLRNLTENLYSGEWCGVGGRVLPPPFSPPPWLSPESSLNCGPLAIFNPRQEAGNLNEPPFGANMAFRRDVFDRFGGFRTDLGRVGGKMISNEDTEFGRRLLAAGLRVRYEPSALTYHPIDENRLHKGYFLNWWFNKGRSDVRESGNPADEKSFLGMPTRWLAALTSGVVRWMVAFEPSKRFGCKLLVWAYAGQITESFYLWLAAKRKKPVHDLRKSVDGDSG